MSGDYFGWDLLYSSVEKDIKNNQDILVCFVHFILVSNGFRCIGLGNNGIIDGSQKREVLPKGWNAIYQIKYVFKDHLYIFKAINLDGGVMLNLERADSKTVSLVQLKTRLVVKKSGTLEEMIPDYKSVVDKIRRQLLEKVGGFRKIRDGSTQTQERMSYFDSLNILRARSGESAGDTVKFLYKGPSAKVRI